MATINTSDITIVFLVTIVAVGGVKLGYAYSAMRVVSFARGLEKERAVKNTAGGFMVCAGAYLIAKA